MRSTRWVEWLARHSPWWVPMALWYPVMALGALFWVGMLLAAVVGAIDSAVDLDGWQALRALVLLVLGLGAAVGWFEEAAAWRELTPSTLRGGQGDVRQDRPGRRRKRLVVEQFRRGLAEGRRDIDRNRGTDTLDP